MTSAVKKALPILFAFCSFLAYGQQMMTVSPEVSADFMVRKILLNDGQNLGVSNVRLRGHGVSSAVFENTSKYYLMKKGILLTTGRAEDAIGPNDTGNTGVSLHVPGDAALESIATGKTFDACVLSFEFSPESDSISFNYIFASEEYPEYVNQGVNDIFAFFLTRLKTGETKNLAVFGDKATRINVDNINDLRNSSLYIPNAEWDPNNIMQWASDPGRGELALTYQYDGFTVRMTAGSAVVPRERYRITFAIADVGDDLYDSAVFLEQNSFGSSSRSVSADQRKIEKKLRNVLTDQSVEIIQDGEEVRLRLYILFDFDDDRIIREKDMQQLKEISRMLRLNGDLDVRIEGHTDNVGSDDYNDDLSGRRAFSVATFLMDNGVNVDRLAAFGYGAKQPIAENATKSGRDRNRRVELVFH